MLFERIHLNIADEGALLRWVQSFDGANRSAYWSLFEDSVEAGHALISMSSGQGYERLLEMCRAAATLSAPTSAPIGEDDDEPPAPPPPNANSEAARRLTLLRDQAERWLWTTEAADDHYDPAHANFVNRLRRTTGLYVSAGQPLRAALEPALRAATKLQLFDSYAYSISNREALYSLIAWVRDALPNVHEIEIIGFLGQLPGTDKRFKIARRRQLKGCGGCIHCRSLGTASEAADFFRTDLLDRLPEREGASDQNKLLVKGTIIDVSRPPAEPDALRFRVHDRMLCLCRHRRQAVVAVGYGTYAFSKIDQPDAPDAPIHTTLARLPTEAMKTIVEQYGIGEVSVTEGSATWEVSLSRPLSPKAAPPSSS